MEINSEETAVIRAFTRLMKDTGYLSSIRFKKLNSGLGFVCIYKEEGKWIYYIVDHNTKFDYKEYDNLYRLCIEFFYTLNKKDTMYCLKNFPSYINEEISNIKTR